MLTNKSLRTSVGIRNRFMRNQALIRRCALRIALLLLLIFSLLAIYWAIVVHLPAINPELVKQLKPGMTKEEVTSILGQPQRELFNGTIWVYHRPFAWPSHHVYFDEEGRLEESFEHD